MTSPSTTGELDPGRLRELLEEAFEGQLSGPPAAVIEAGGRRRLRRRRASWSAGIAAAAVVIAAAGGITAAARPWSDSHGSGEYAAHSVPAGWRTLHWQQTTFGVPGSWLPGDPTQWCTWPDKNPPAMYWVPDQSASSSVLCNPENWYGAAVRPADSVPADVRAGQPVHQVTPAEAGVRYPDKAWVGSVPLPGPWVLVVVAHSQKTAPQVISSATQ